MRKIKSLYLHFKKIANPVLLTSAIILLFIHHFYTDSSDRIAWYLREICGKISHLFIAIVFYRMCIKFQYDLLNVYFKSFFISLFIILPLQIVDSLVSFVFQKHWHNSFLAAEATGIFSIIIYLLSIKYEWSTRGK
jgi:hypothetical protein